MLKKHLFTHKVLHYKDRGFPNRVCQIGIAKEKSV